MVRKRRSSCWTGCTSLENLDGGIGQSPSFWLLPPDPTFALSHRAFRPTRIFLPRLFLWLPHFLVEKLCCRSCGLALEKNGPLPPRQITDTSDDFFLLNWAYRCRTISEVGKKKTKLGCGKVYRGWLPALLAGLPARVRLAFPAVLSRKRGLSHAVLTAPRVNNQHKMGPSGTRSLLLEQHTKCFNTLQLQYIEAIFAIVRARADRADPLDPNTSRQHAPSTPSAAGFFAPKQQARFGSFGDLEGYGGRVPSDRYLTAMLIRAVELDEADSDQHASLLLMNIMPLDDSYKVRESLPRSLELS